MKEDEVILVNEQDDPVGVMGKTQVHQRGLLHRAFSIFIFDSSGRMLLQQRALDKYHSGHLWTNACCSHPYPGETVQRAAQRRLHDELGFSTSLQPIFNFTYRADVGNNLVEHEFDHVFAGEYEGIMNLNPAEVADVKYEDMAQLKLAIDSYPAKFTTWFRIAFPKVESWWIENYGTRITAEKTEEPNKL
jgi:isopentenyl-diphosphate Delta-isomerase